MSPLSIISYIIPTASKVSFSWSLRIRIYFHCKLFHFISQICLLTFCSTPSTWYPTPGIFQPAFSKISHTFCMWEKKKYKMKTLCIQLLFTLYIRLFFFYKVRNQPWGLLGSWSCLQLGSLLTFFSNAGNLEAEAGHDHTL